MTFLSFSKSSLLILAVSAMAFTSCKKDASPELADTFVAKYTGTYTESNSGNTFSANNVPATITKKTATEVNVELSVLGASISLKGTAKNDTLVELPIQPFGTGQLTAIGSCVVKNGAIDMRFASKSSNSTSTTFSTFVGKK
jgi:hypothetical protein